MLKATILWYNLIKKFPGSSSYLIVANYEQINRTSWLALLNSLSLPPLKIANQFYSQNIFCNNMLLCCIKEFLIFAGEWEDSSYKVGWEIWSSTEVLWTWGGSHFQTFPQAERGPTTLSKLPTYCWWEEECCSVNRLFTLTSFPIHNR